MWNLNVTEDGNYTSLCRTGLRETHQKIVYSTVNSTLAVIAVLGNVLIIAALQKASSLHPPSKLLLGCLATTDLCVGLITRLFGVTRRLQKLLLSFDDFNRLTVIFGGVSLLTLTAISVDRLLARLSGLRYRQVVTLRRARILIAMIWLFALSVAMIFFINYVITISIICIAIVLCIVTSFLCYTKIYLTLRHHQAQVPENVLQGETNGGRYSLNIERYKNTVSSALWVQITLVVCSLPYAIVAAITVITRMQTQLLELSFEAAISILLLNSSLNPFLYCWKMKEVRQALNNTIRQL